MRFNIFRVFMYLVLLIFAFIVSYFGSNIIRYLIFFVFNVDSNPYELITFFERLTLFLCVSFAAVIGWKQSRKVYKSRNLKYLFIQVSVFTLIGFFVGFLTGLDLGGNYYPRFNFLGLRGYEALSLLLSMIGSVLGILAGSIIYWLVNILVERVHMNNKS